MAKVEVNACDVDYADGILEPGEDYIVSLQMPGGEEEHYVITLCSNPEACGESKIFHDLMTLLGKHGRKITGGLWTVVDPTSLEPPREEKPTLPPSQPSFPSPLALAARPTTSVGAAMAKALQEKEQDDDKEGKRVPLPAGEASSDPDPDSRPKPEEIGAKEHAEDAGPEAGEVEDQYNYVKRPEKREKVPDWVRDKVRVSCKTHGGSMKWASMNMHMHSHLTEEPQDVPWTFTGIPGSGKPVHCFTCKMPFPHGASLWGHGASKGHPSFLPE